MADMTREEVIDTLKRLKTTHIGDFGWDTTGVKALDFAISDMKRVEELERENEELRKKIETLCCDNFELFGDVAKLETENKRLKEGIANVKAEIEKYTVVDICKVSHVLQIIKKYLGR